MDFKKIKIISIAVIACLAFGFVFSLTGHAAIKATSGDKFCATCHSWMDPMVDTYRQDVHAGNNPLGVKADCVSCHLPHDSLAGYLFTKGVNGLSEVTSVIVSDAKAMDWQEHRSKRESFVYDSGCMSCHSNIETTKEQSAAANKMHTLYTKYKDDSQKALQCATCHKTVGHTNLGKTLRDIKHPPVGEWESDLKK